MTRIEFGWSCAGPAWEQSPEPPILAAAAQHFDSLWNADHHYGFRQVDGLPQAWLECWTSLTWLAARYPQVKVGQLVLAVGWRNPALLAHMAATLQVLSRGRLILGIGGGWREEEYAAYGYEFPPAAERIGQLEEAIKIMRLMWSEPGPSFKGKYFQIERAYCEPRPEVPPPILIGGSGPQRTIPLAARVADMWDVYHGGTIEELPIEKYTSSRDLLYTHLEKASRTPDDIIQSFTVGSAQLPRSRDESERWLERLRALVGLGVRQIILSFQADGTPELVARFEEEVMSTLRAES